MKQELTGHQNTVLKQALAKLEDNNTLLIKGSAGVGKTFMVNSLINLIKATNRRIKKVVCSAPTHKALAVLKNKITIACEFKTTHAALNLKLKTCFRTGKRTFEQDILPDEQIDLLIVDEASMLNIELVAHICNLQEHYGTVVVYLGDIKQLPPVNEDEPTVFISDFPSVELTEIIRQGTDNPIINLSRDLGKIYTQVNDFNQESMCGYLHTRDKDYIVNKLSEVNGTDEIKYLAWTNKKVDEINHAVRNKIYGTPNKIELNETLIFNTAYRAEYFTNQEIKVTSLEAKKIDVKYPVKRNGKNTETKSASLQVYVINKSIIVIHEDCESELKNIIDKVKQSATKRLIYWTDYYAFVDIFADLTYNHAITIHKSQGSTFQKVVLDINDIFKNKKESEKNKLLYTAITRASDLVVMLNI
jgi:exodeoxyribonuclease-5